MKPNKKKPRIRNRPRNKANRLLALQGDQQSQEEESLPLEENIEPTQNLNSKEENVSDDEDDEDMPGLEDESEPTEDASHELDAVTTIHRKMHEKILKTQGNVPSSGQTPKEKETQRDNQKSKVKEKTPETKPYKSGSKNAASNNNNKPVPETGEKNPKVNQKPKEKSKEKENLPENKTEKSAFIQNLQKKMEAMMSDGDENLPNTLMENLKKLLDQKPMTDIESSDDDEEYVEYIYKPRKYFLVGLCNLCKCDLCKIEQLIECSKCHMTYYCNIDHMQNDVEHRQLCSALQQVAAADVSGGHIFAKCSDMTPDQFRSYRIIVIRKVSEILQRPLTATEQEVLLFPRLCINAKCRKFEGLTDCPNCGMVAYCTEPLHLVADHDKWCRFYQLFKELVMQQEKFGRLDPSLPSKILKDTPLVCNTTREIFKKLNIDLPENSCEFAALTQISTAPLTAWYALKLTQQLNKHEELTIHLIGAEIEFEVDILHKWEQFFLHITPMVKTLHVVFVGPELNPNNISFEQLQKTKCCKVCQKNQRTVKYFFEANIYHDYCRSKRFLTPNLVCFFNAGLYRSTGFNMEDTWPETISAAAKLHVPIVVTAYTEYESPLDLERFLEESNRDMKLLEKPSENLFSSFKPERNFISDDEAPFMFKNYYSFVLQ
ncbi:uncharacterized protein LOC131803082 [Musca domestica]|uniref:Uncharacterized protein LOC131803082 n=1 Tax=Musca domestica TaxID=7370 RepID=A0A1I8MQT3_MUSDO|nr:uncharacterized protein LOC131803082 [Musca domestica]